MKRLPIAVLVAAVVALLGGCEAAESRNQPVQVPESPPGPEAETPVEAVPHSECETLVARARALNVQHRWFAAERAWHQAGARCSEKHSLAEAQIAHALVRQRETESLLPQPRSTKESNAVLSRAYDARVSTDYQRCLDEARASGASAGVEALWLASECASALGKAVLANEFASAALRTVDSLSSGARTSPRWTTVWLPRHPNSLHWVSEHGLYVTDKGMDGSERSWKYHRNSAGHWEGHAPEELAWKNRQTVPIPDSRYALEGFWDGDDARFLKLWDIHQDRFVWQTAKLDPEVDGALSPGRVRLGGKDGSEILLGVQYAKRADIIRLRLQDGAQLPPIEGVTSGNWEFTDFDAIAGQRLIALQAYDPWRNGGTYELRLFDGTRGRVFKRFKLEDSLFGGGTVFLEPDTLITRDEGKVQSVDLRTFHPIQTWSVPNKQYSLPQVAVCGDHTLIEVGGMLFQLVRDADTGRWSDTPAPIGGFPESEDRGETSGFPLYSPNHERMAFIAGKGSEVLVWESVNPAQPSARFATSGSESYGLELDVDRPRLAAMADGFAVGVDLEKEQVTKYRLPKDPLANASLAWSDAGLLLVSENRHCILRSEAEPVCFDLPIIARGKSLVRGNTICLQTITGQEGVPMSCARVGSRQVLTQHVFPRAEGFALGLEGEVLAALRGTSWPNNDGEPRLESLPIASGSQVRVVPLSVKAVGNTGWQAPQFYASGGGLIDLHTGSVTSTKPMMYNGIATSAPTLGGYRLGRVGQNRAALLKPDGSIAGMFELGRQGPLFVANPSEQTRNAAEYTDGRPGRFGSTSLEMLTGDAERVLRCVLKDRFFAWVACRDMFERPGLLWDTIREVSQ